MVHDARREDGEPSPKPDIRKVNPTGCLGCGGAVAWKFLYCEACVRDGIPAEHRAKLPRLEPAPLDPADQERVNAMHASVARGREREAIRDRLHGIFPDTIKLLDGFQETRSLDPFVVRVAVREWGVFGSSCPARNIVVLEMTLDPALAEVALRAIAEAKNREAK